MTSAASQIVVPGSRAAGLIAQLGLRPHPEGGHYAELFRSPHALPAHGGTRAAVTAIWYLLTAGQCSRWHLVRSDEIWNWYEGGDLELLRCPGPGQPVQVHRLGPVDDAGRTPQAVVPAGTWQAARPVGDHALVGCTVAPGFDFADFSLLQPSSDVAGWLRSQADPRLVDG
ncbi:cupin [Planctomycetota bacterium]|nr:cupin [Planctomycetota bacterium]